jgi:hypothetical protein
MCPHLVAIGYCRLEFQHKTSTIGARRHILNRSILQVGTNAIKISPGLKPALGLCVIVGLLGRIRTNLREPAGQPTLSNTSNLPPEGLAYAKDGK